MKQTAKDVSKKAAEVIQQTKEKVGSGEITTGTVLESVKEKTQDVVEKSQEVYHSFKDKLQKENLSGNDLVQSIRKQTESEDIVLDLDEKDPEEAAEEETKEA